MLSRLKNCEVVPKTASMTRVVKPYLATPDFADERRGRAWWLSAFAAVLGSVSLTLFLNPQTLWRPVLALALALLAAGYAISTGERRRPVSIRGLLGGWWVAFSLPLIYSGPLEGAGGNLEHFSGNSAAILALIFSFTFQGSSGLFLAVQALYFAASLAGAIGAPSDFLLKTSAMFFSAAFGVFFLRVSRTRAALTLWQLESSRERTLLLRGKIGDLVDSSEAARERLLGPLTPGLSFYSVQASLEKLRHEEQNQGPMLTVETLVSEARKSLLQIQRNWSSKLMAGPVRFVFFPPVTGTEMSTLVVGDVTTLVAGIETCLRLALESLPEAGPRRDRREGVVRLSIRVGLRVVEIAVEDNGRGTFGVVGATELVEKLTGLRRFAESHGGKLDRFARLGVGARTVIELPLRIGSRDFSPVQQFGALPDSEEIVPFTTELNHASEAATGVALRV